jgi:hypothetical protein
VRQFLDENEAAKSVQRRWRAAVVVKEQRSVVWRRGVVYKCPARCVAV